MTDNQYTQIVEWLYTHDGVYPSKAAWRKDFLKFCKEVLKDNSNNHA